MSEKNIRSAPAGYCREKEGSMDKWYDFLRDRIAEESWEYGRIDYAYRYGMVIMASISGLIDVSQEEKLKVFVDECYKLAKKKGVETHE